jgi:hypothetical protein
MHYLKITIISSIVCLLSPALWAGDLDGFWQNEEQPAWIEIRFDDDRGTGTVLRNDKKPEAVGRVLLKDLVAEDEAQSWSGQIYAERFKEYKDAIVTLPEPGRMEIKVKVGFMSRTVQWNRVDALPPE